MLAWLCQKHRSCRPDRPSLCSGYHRQETKLIVRPCDKTRWPHASPPRIITGRSSKNWPPLWSWLAATARTPAPLMDPADRRWYTLQHSCWMVHGSSSWPLWFDPTDLCCLRDLTMMMMNVPILKISILIHPASLQMSILSCRRRGTLTLEFGGRLTDTEIWPKPKCPPISETKTE